MDENYTAEFPLDVKIAISIQIQQNDPLLIRLFSTLKKTLIDSIQQPCLLCGDISRNSPRNNQCLCRPCMDDLPFIRNSCHTCGLPLPSHQAHCGICLKTPPPYDGCVSLLHYQSPVDYLIKKMKYHRQLTVADLFGSLLANKIQHNDAALPELIIPIPLHPQRLQQRGYNQAIEISRPLSKRLNIPLDIKCAKRQRNTTPQFDLPPEQRNKNLRNAFEIIHPIQAKHVAVVDDVMTTGSTVSSFSQTLLDAGVTRVDIWACARATTN